MASQRSNTDRPLGAITGQEIVTTTGSGLQNTSIRELPQQEKSPMKISKHDRGWRRIVRNFTPSWFAVCMGTGIVSILLHNLPYNGDWLYYLSIIVFCLNIVLFVSFLAISILRYTLYPEIWWAMIRHPAQSLFLGTFPMALATIINMIVFVCVPAWGDRFVQLAWALWWIDVALSLACCFYMPFVIMYIHQTTLQTMTAAWLLPIVAPIVASASGGIVASVLPNPQHALWTVIVSYILWGTGIPLAMCVLVIYFQRLTLHALPPREVIVSVFLPIGPLGQGGFAIMQLGKVAMDIFPTTHTLSLQPAEGGLVNAGQFLYVLGWLIATVLWGFGLVWLFFRCGEYYEESVPVQHGLVGIYLPVGRVCDFHDADGEGVAVVVFQGAWDNFLRCCHAAVDHGRDWYHQEGLDGRDLLRAWLEESRGEEGTS